MIDYKIKESFEIVDYLLNQDSNLLIMLIGHSDNGRVEWYYFSFEEIIHCLGEETPIDVLMYDMENVFMSVLEYRKKCAL